MILFLFVFSILQFILIEFFINLFDNEKISKKIFVSFILINRLIFITILIIRLFLDIKHPYQSIQYIPNTPIPNNFDAIGFTILCFNYFYFDLFKNYYNNKNKLE